MPVLSEQIKLTEPNVSTAVNFLIKTFCFTNLLAPLDNAIVIKAGNANMFLSPLFRDAFVNTIGARLELYDTDGAKGAALGAGVGAGLYANFKEAFRGLHIIGSEEPEKSRTGQYQNAYSRWKDQLTKLIA